MKKSARHSLRAGRSIDKGEADGNNKRPTLDASAMAREQSKRSGRKIVADLDSDGNV
eukprot:CAMPEP_0119560986 /NCGR_PEP_ID=MMETSP1352-20130426/16359_1 /TAXON_ID=265584 /ORGANISM="Stauroneis constricta, Strain CCMP1120" /LENGTH=56 /DNA_ID=CAMNT_0007609079 /DNA_START=1 /DNA_END=167 /DNA_ORIENTATION=-